MKFASRSFEPANSTARNTSSPITPRNTPTESTGTELATVAVLVLNWNGKDDTLECLETLVCQTHPNTEIIVIDNGSTDGSAEAIGTKYPQVTLIETGVNLGYAGGNNVGIRYAIDNGFSYFLVLNNDTICPKNLVRELVDATKALPDVSFIGPVIYFASDSNKIWSAGSHWNTISQHLEVIDSIPRLTQESKTLPVDSIVGCALFGRTSIIKQIGMFDEKFFLVHEESDLCYRANAAGYRCYIAINVSIAHKVSASFGGNSSPLMTYFDERNTLLWASRHLSKRLFLSLLLKRVSEPFRLILLDVRHLKIARPKQLYWQMLEALASIRHRIRDPRYQAQLCGIRDYCLQRFGDCPTSVRKLNSRA